MSKKNRVRVIKVGAAAMAVMLLGMLLWSRNAESDWKEKQDAISVYLWSADLMTDYAPYIQSQLPDVNIEFVVGNNDLDFYRFMMENDAMPDLITNRRFSLYDAKPLNDQLLDLTYTQEVETIYLAYLENYTNSDGTVNWLPLCAEVDGLIANKKMFEQYDIDLPTDYDSFIAACQAFEEKGIRGFAADFAYDYTCLEILQGLSIPELTSMDGQFWRHQYEDTTSAVNGLDDKIWPGAFQRMEQFIRDTNMQEDDVWIDHGKIEEMFQNGEVAIIRGTGAQVIEYEAVDGIDPLFLPYFGQNGEEWLLTYPAFQVALDRNLESDAWRKEQAFRILDVMLSEEGQNFLAQKKDVIPYSRNVKLELSESLSNLQPYIEKNRLYVRLASNDFFAVSKDVVQKMIRGEYDAKQAYAAFDAQLKAAKDKTEETVRTFTQGYENKFYLQGGNQAFSVMAGTLRKHYGSDVLLAPSYCFTGAVFEADYTEEMLENMIMPNALEAWQREMTGNELKQFIRILVEGEDGCFKPFNCCSLPTVSGITIEVEEKDGSYQLLGVLEDGKEILEDKLYGVTCLDKACYLEPIANILFPQEGLAGFRKEERLVRKEWSSFCRDDGELSKPECYMILHDQSLEKGKGDYTE